MTRCPRCGGRIVEIDRAFVVDDAGGRLYFKDNCGLCGYELFRSGDLLKAIDAEQADDSKLWDACKGHAIGGPK